VCRRSVNHDQGQLRHDPAQIVKTGNDDFRINGLFKEERMEAKVGAQEGQHVDSVTGSGGDFDGFADRLPGVRHTGIEREAGFIEVVEINLAGFSLCAKACQFGLRGLKVLFVAFAAQTAPEALPGFVAFLEDAFERITADLFAGLFFDLQQTSFGRARVFLDNFDRLLLLFFVEGWFASTSLLIQKTFNSYVFPAIRPVADRIAIDLINVCDLVYALSTSIEQDRVSASTRLFIARFHQLA